AILVIIHAYSSRAGIFKSNGNYSYTGYSTPFTILDRDDYSKLSKQYSTLSVNVNHTGEVTFFNKNGNSSTYVLNQGLKAILLIFRIIDYRFYHQYITIRYYHSIYYHYPK
ncbi:hypothetical protein N7513_012704, partial [Penicillium frequentans]